MILNGLEQAAIGGIRAPIVEKEQTLPTFHKGAVRNSSGPAVP